jgi:hypothetical protein
MSQEDIVYNMIKVYTIEGECPEELEQAIGMLRQLINEEFKPKKTVTSQFIYDIIYPAVKELL